MPGPVAIVLLEDEPSIAQFESWLLESAGHDVVALTTADDIRLALMPGTWARADVAVIDLNLPGISGIDIMRFIRARCPWVRIVVTTAQVHVSEEAARLADVVLFKPYSLEDLKRAVVDLGR